MLVIAIVRVVVAFLCLVCSAIRAFAIQTLSCILVKVVLDLLSSVIIVVGILIVKADRLLHGSLISTSLFSPFFLIILWVQVLGNCLLMLLVSFEVVIIGIDWFGCVLV